jgi:cysteine dioxygenase
MKMLKGTLQETLYDWPDQSLVAQGECAPPTVKKQTVYHKNEVTYISGKRLFLYDP